MPSFDLRYEPWIPVTCEDGTHREVSTFELFERAHTLRAIGGDLPQQIMPILRLHLAILRRAFGDANLNQRRLDKWWCQTWEQGSFDADVIREYLERFPEEFNLFGPHPFFQVAGLEYVPRKDEKEKENDDRLSISKLMADVPKMDKYLFSMRSKSSLDLLTPAEATRWLIFTQAYDVSGIKSAVVGNTSAKGVRVYSQGLINTGWAGCIGGVFLEGVNVFQTLMWNLVLHDAARGNFSMFGDPDDLPPWERPMPSPDQRVAPATGVVDLETRQSRRMRLVVSEDDDCIVGVICCYGDLITNLSDSFKFEMMTSWCESKEQRKKLQTAYVPSVPVQHEGGRALWHGLASLVSMSGETNGGCRPGVIRWAEHVKGLIGEKGSYPEQLTIRAQGMEYGKQRSEFTNGFDDSLSLGMALMRHDSPAVLQAVALVDKAERAVSELVELAKNIKRIGVIGDDKRKDKPLKKAVFLDVRERAYDEVDGIFRAYLAGLTEDVDAACYTDEYAERIRGCILGLGSEIVRVAEMPLFMSHDSKHSPSYLSQAQAMFVRNVYRLLSGSDKAGRENGRA